VLNETETEDPIGRENRPTGRRRFVVAGVGDAFTAALVIGVLQGKDFNAINEEANRLASAVCTRSGAISAFRPSGKYV
jgi:pyridoxal/pyridoxine/pyridoxamine kinase